MSKNLEVEQIVSRIDDTQVVVLSESKIETFQDLLNILFEYLIFFKWIYFKNRVRGNLFFLRSILMVLTFALLYFKFFASFNLVIMGVDIDPVIAFGGAIVINYWAMVQSFASKSVLCLNVYNDVLKAYGAKNIAAAELLRNSLALQVVTVDMWGHRLFSPMFISAIKSALIQRYSATESNLTEANRAVELFISGKTTPRQLRILLTEHQREMIWKMTEAKI
jgi:hypothetical protein